MKVYDGLDKDILVQEIRDQFSERWYILINLFGIHFPS